MYDCVGLAIVQDGKNFLAHVSNGDASCGEDEIASKISEEFRPTASDLKVYLLNTSLDDDFTKRTRNICLEALSSAGVKVDPIYIPFTGVRRLISDRVIEHTVGENQENPVITRDFPSPKEWVLSLIERKETSRSR